VTDFRILGPPPYLGNGWSYRNFKFGIQICHWGPNEKMRN